MEVHLLVVDTFYILPKYLYLCATFYSIRSQKIVALIFSILRISDLIPYCLCFGVCKKGKSWMEHAIRQSCGERHGQPLALQPSCVCMCEYFQIVVMHLMSMWVRLFVSTTAMNWVRLREWRPRSLPNSWSLDMNWEFNWVRKERS